MMTLAELQTLIVTVIATAVLVGGTFSVLIAFFRK